MLLGLLLALAASVLFNVAVAIQALDARVLPRELSLRFGLLRRLVRRRRWRIGMLPPRPCLPLPRASAGVAFALSGFVTKLVSDDLSSGAVFSAWLWADLVGVAAVIGVLSENSAFQTRPASQVAPLVFSAQTVLPVLLAPLVGGEDWSQTPLGGSAVLLALSAVVAGVVLIARSRVVSTLISPHATELAVD